MFANPLTERLAGFVRDSGIDVRAAERGVPPFPHMLHWFRQKD
jgi:hypothetical protein